MVYLRWSVKSGLLTRIGGLVEAAEAATWAKLTASRNATELH